MTTATVRRILGITVPLAALLFIAAAWRFWSSPPPPHDALTLGISYELYTLPIIVAEEQGFLKDEGLEVTIKPFPSGKAAFEAQLRGEVEVASVAETPIVFNSFKRRDFVVIGSFSHSDGGSRLVAHPESGIRKAADLPGHRVGVLWGTSAHHFLYSLLADHGLKPADITVVPLEGPKMAGALAARQVDAIAAFEPYSSQSIAALTAAGAVLDCNRRCRTTLSYTTSRDFPQRRAAAAQRLLRATKRAIDWIRAHRQQAIALVSRRLNIDSKAIEAQWNDYRFDLALEQDYLISLENQARWVQSAFPEATTTLPNYLDYIDVTPLSAVEPDTVTLIH